MLSIHTHTLTCMHVCAHSGWGQGMGSLSKIHLAFLKLFFEQICYKTTTWDQ